MNRLLFLALASVLLMLSCGGKKETAPAEETPVDTMPQTIQDTVAEDTLEQLIAQTPMPRAADELFDDFLFNFSANRQLQMERVAFPLPVIRNGKVKDTSVSEATVEKIYFNTGAVMQYQFKRVKGAWMLLEIKTEPIAANHNASFLEFYHQFVTDSIFQIESIGHTVRFVGPDPDDDFARMEGILTPDTWPAFAPELPDRMIYNVVYGKATRDSKQKIFVMRGIANGLEVEMTFRCEDDRWQLVKLTN